MSGSEHSIHQSSENGGTQPEGSTLSEKKMSVRSASPAKRSATEMESSNAAKGTSLTRRASSSLAQDEDPSLQTDVLMTVESPAEATIHDGQTGAPSEDPPAYPSIEGTAEATGSQEPYTTEEIDEQVERVRRVSDKPLDEGDRGVLISKRWLDRVLSRSSDGLSSNNFSKESREGPVGPVDNSDIIEEDSVSDTLIDAAGHAFIPLRSGLSEGDDFQIIPFDAYGDVVLAYGTREKAPIVRYAHNTVDGDAQNIQYELYPPRITICKVPQPKDPELPIKVPTALESLRLKKERAGRGQNSPDDAVILVISKQDRFQKFLARGKDAAGISPSTKVKVWRVLDSSKVAADRPATSAGVQTPPESRESSPHRNTSTSRARLVLQPATFKELEVGRDVEALDVKDETGNAKYNGSRTTEMLGLTTDQIIVLEEQIGGPGGGEFVSDNQKSSKLMLRKPANVSRPTSTTTSGRTSPAPGGIMTRGRTRKGGRPRGLTGLTNLGNTCYMNSALQCIRSIEELTVYFLMNKFKSEINNGNPLGHHGAIANAYSGVVRGLWDGDNSFTPSNFKRQIGNVNYQFASYGQQDSQEFLSTLVDALHEDLNRILVKPYQPYPDSDDSTVHDPQAIIELGDVYRKIFTARNASVAMDLFLGFYKNTIECPDCKKVSITFDPYTSLTLQLPIEDSFSHRITFIPLEGSPINHDIDLDKNSTIKTVKQFIAQKHPGVDPARLWMIEQYSHKVFKVFDDAWTLGEASIGNNDHVFLYELDSIATNIGVPKRPTYMSSRRVDDSVPLEGMASPQADCLAVPVFHRLPKQPFHGSKSPEFVLHPMYITLTRDEAKDYQIIVKKVLDAVFKLTTRSMSSELNEPRTTHTSSDEASEESAVHVGSEESIAVSDNSAEDGYVNVSIEAQDPASAEPSNASEAQQGLHAGFMEPGELQERLFELKVGDASDNMHCAAMSGIDASTITNMLDKVKQAARRSSTQSVASAASTSVSASEGGDNEATEDAAEDQDEPDIVIGGEQSPESQPADESDEDKAPEPTIMEPSVVVPKYGRRRGNNKKIRRGKHGRMLQRPPRSELARHGGLNKVNDTPAPQVKPSIPEEEPYYVRIGQGIVLDWFPKAFDRLFGGKSSNAEETRGTRTTDDDGKHVPVFPDAELQAKKEKKRLRSKHGITLDACFEETSKSEVLSEENAWYCNRCKEKRRATKQLQIWTLPDILVVHLKRFSNRTMRGKIDVLVDYPIEGLDLNDQVGLKEDGKDYTYDLFAVDNHMGSLGGGHYTAFAKNFEDGQWYDYNDSMCSKIGSTERLKTASAYLLFYRRRSDKPLGPPYLQELVNEYRNPAAAEEADDLDAGEGQLGGPVTSLHGSSSGSAAAGVVARTSPRGPGGDGGADGALADSSLTTKAMMTRVDENDTYESRLASFRRLETLSEPTWSFTNAEDMHTTDDNDSNAAEVDHDSAFGGSNSYAGDAMEHHPSSPMDVAPSPMDTHEINLEDTSMGSDLALPDEDEVADIHVSDSHEGDEDAAMRRNH